MPAARASVNVTSAPAQPHNRAAVRPSRRTCRPIGQPFGRAAVRSVPAASGTATSGADRPRPVVARRHHRAGRPAERAAQLLAQRPDLALHLAEPGDQAGLPLAHGRDLARDDLAHEPLGRLAVGRLVPRRRRPARPRGVSRPSPASMPPRALVGDVVGLQDLLGAAQHPHVARRELARPALARPRLRAQPGRELLGPASQRRNRHVERQAGGFDPHRARIIARLEPRNGPLRLDQGRRPTGGSLGRSLAARLSFLAIVSQGETTAWRTRNPPSSRSASPSASASATGRSRRASRTRIGKAVTSIAGSAAAERRRSRPSTEAISQLDRAASKGVIHPNNAARRKSRLMKRLNAARGQRLARPPGQPGRSRGLVDGNVCSL